MKTSDLTNIDDIITKLNECDDAYFNSEKEIMSDAEYDILKRTAQNLDPNNPYFIQTGTDVRGGKLTLPFPMEGLSQRYDNEVLSLWIDKLNFNNNDIVISDKLDGVSCLLLFADKDGDGNAEFQIAYSRGNTIQGADITRHVKHLDFPKVIKNCSLYVVRGELIMKDKIFRSKYINKFASARGAVAGNVNRKTPDVSLLKDVDLIAYSLIKMVHAVPTDWKNNKENCLNSLKYNGFDIPNIVIAKGKTLTEQNLINFIEQAKANSKYELDGIVLTDNLSHQSIKYKTIDKNSVVDSEVIKIHWKISKNGFLKPRVEIRPVKLYDTIVTYATGFNAGYIHKNSIGPGTILTITKGGSVIPDILGVKKSTSPQMPIEDWEWNENKVEAVVKNLDKHPVVRFEQVLDFFESLEVDLLKEASLKKVFTDLQLNEKIDKVSYADMLNVIIDLTEKEWEQIIGANGVKIYESLHRRLSNMKLETIMGSLNYCGMGFGIRRAKILLSQIDESIVWDLTKDDIMKLNGFDEKTATKIEQGLPMIKKFIDNNKDNITFVKIQKTDELKDIAVVFTGFRDKDMQEKIEKMGGKVQSGVSKATTHLVSVDGDATSVKGKKALALGVKVFSLPQFKNQFNL